MTVHHRKLPEARRQSFGRVASVGGAGAGNGRCIDYIFSDQSVARDGHTITTAGWDLEAFKSNPVFLWAHQTDEPPVGRVISIGPVGTELRGTVEYPPEGMNPFADMIYRMVKEGFLNATSVSWNPLKYRFSNDKMRPGGIDFLEQEMLEISQVPVPALPTALATARAAGIDTAPFCRWAERELEKKENFAMPPQLLEASRRAARAAEAQEMRRGMPAIVAATTQSPFRSFGDQLGAIARSAFDRIDDPRLVRAPTVAGELDPTSGGFLVPEIWAEPLVKSIYRTGLLASLCDQRTTDRPLAATKIPSIDENSRQDGSRWGGVVVTWAHESEFVDSSFPRWKLIEFSAKKLLGLARTSSELVADVPMLESYITTAFAAEISFQLDEFILTGNGAGHFLGLLSSPALITVAKENGQAPATLTASNIRSMWSQMPAPCRRNAVWVVNEDIESVLDENQAAFSGLFAPAGSNGTSMPMLKGRPIVTLEQSPVLGVTGDIVLADLSQYCIVSGPLNSAVSVHARFVNDEITFRVALRVDGRPLWSSPIAAYNGSGTRSPFIALAAR